MFSPWTQIQSKEDGNRLKLAEPFKQQDPRGLSLRGGGRSSIVLGQDHGLELCWRKGMMLIQMQHWVISQLKKYQDRGF